jgi:hypothetical protein
MNKNITMLNQDAIGSLSSNYVSNMLQHAYIQHERFGDGLAMTLQILLELQALIADEIEDVKCAIINDELNQLWTIVNGGDMDAGGRPDCNN